MAQIIDYTINHEFIEKLTIGDINDLLKYINDSTTNERLLNCFKLSKDIKLVDIDKGLPLRKYDFLKDLTKDDIKEFVDLLLNIENYEKYSTEHNINMTHVIDIVKQLNSKFDKESLNFFYDFIYESIHEELIKDTKVMAVSKKMAYTLMTPLVIAGSALVGGIGLYLMYLNQVYKN